MKYFIKNFLFLGKNLFLINSAIIATLNKHSHIHHPVAGNYFFLLSIDLIYFYVKNLFNKLFISIFFSKSFFHRFVYIISVGLGFRRRRRNLRGKKMLELYIGNRHRLAFTFDSKSFLFVFKRSNILIFSNSKNAISLPLLQFRSMRKELVFKIKGFFINRVRIRKRMARTWAFARRVKFKKVKTKLSKKQKFV